ncbi:histidine kinase [Paenibacillus phoenicis]|uniref:histidine kinase n=1 Tax=Paenibacillus phoenicis TaxID=554117 RepID=A0ABU5PHL8_9BACL|nr:MULTISPECIES: histidine kinase [Paenibacillus]MCT2193911.1 histidine kinase [Paenibacillus sp. p3-SID1389]MEA3569401.1 histidine kinase [Paenibacillus phoenicis]
MSYKFTKWLILIVPTLVVGVWEVVRHQFLMPFVSMELGNVLTPVILFAVSITLQYRWFSNLERMQEELQRERALKARLEQREQLARELHDGIAQSLFLLSVKVDRAERQQQAAGSSYDWNGLRKSIHEVNRYVREAISDLRIPPDSREGEADEASMSAIVRRIAVEQQLTLHLDWQLEEAGWPAKAKMELVSCLREAVINAAKHAGVQAIEISASGDAQDFTVTITDHGCGFAQEDQARPGRYGLQIMRERTNEMGWELTVASQPGETTIQIRGGGGSDEGSRVGRG